MLTKVSKKHSILILFMLLANATVLNNIYAQDLMDDTDINDVSFTGANKFSELIKVISRSGKIFIITNNNQMLNKGDFITFSLKDSKPIARAVVAKNHNGSTGIKVLKIYSLKRWGMIKKNVGIDIIKGDDSFLFAPKKKVTDDITDNSINSEEDLYNDKAIDMEEDLSGFYKDSRLIKPDNIVSAGWDRFEFKNDIGDDIQTESHNQFNYTWAYQFSDNIWVEGLYGRVLIDDLPAQGLQTLINNFTVRAKYTFQAPLYSYLMPYVGFQVYNVSSPDAGIIKDNASAEAKATAEKEVALINRLKQNNIVLGVTILKRLVPGWFLKADLGTDILSIGFAIEF
jgi:hypothetical protein